MTPPAGIVLDAAHIAKRFGRHQVLADVTFRMHPGEITGITGENGSGKSTLLDILVGRQRADGGSARLAARVGFCPQEQLIFDTLTVEENLRFFATAYGLDGGRWPATAARLLDRLRFRQSAPTLVAQLSGGTRQKLNLCLAFLHEPDLLVLDEPYAGFDWETYLRFWDFAGELRRRGTAILIVSHFVYDRSQFDTVYQLAGGVLRCA